MVARLDCVVPVPMEAVADSMDGDFVSMETGTGIHVDWEPIRGPQLASVLLRGGPAEPEKPAPDAGVLERALYALQVLLWSNSVMPGVSIVAAPEVLTVQAGTTFIGQASGPSIPVPNGAAGPMAVESGRGIMFVGGSAGASGRVWGVRVMDATDRYPHGYVTYFNNGNQTVNPFTGLPIPRSDPLWHIPLNPSTAP